MSNVVELYLQGFEDSTSMISNVETKTHDCIVDTSWRVPVTVNDTEYSNSYVCSIHTALIPYCMQELEKIDNALVRKIIAKLVRAFDSTLKNHEINKIVQINNWMLSTNIHVDDCTDVKYCDLLHSFSDRYANYCLIIRSLNLHQNTSLIQALRSSGCLMIPTRQVYIFDKEVKNYALTHNYKMDKKLADSTNYISVAQNEIKPADYARIVELYNMLYIQKYSEHNPKFTVKYIETILKHPYFYIEGFRNNEGVLDAIGGRFTIGNTTTLPIVGYDTSKPKKLGLYRLVLISTLLYAEENNLIFNASSGASSFKRLRGAVPFIEYAAVYSKHLPMKRRRIWYLLNLILSVGFVPILKRYKL